MSTLKKHFPWNKKTLTHTWNTEMQHTSCEPELYSRTQPRHRSTQAIHRAKAEKKMKGHVTKTKTNQASTDNHVKFIQISNIQISPPIFSHLNYSHKQRSRGSRLAISPCPKPLCSNKSVQCGRSWRFPVDQSATRVICMHCSGKSTCYCALVVLQFIHTFNIMWRAITILACWHGQ